MYDKKIKMKAQQEMVGFVLIVALVMIALMVFLVIAVRKPAEIRESVEAENLLNSMMKYTTQCAIVYEPDYDSIKELIKSCYDDDRCSNLEKTACQYMNKTISEVLQTLIQSESQISAYQLEIIHKDSQDIASEYLLNLMSGGQCTGSIFGAQEMISVSEGKIIVRLNMCYSS